jgi:hypothetical protein
VIGELVIQFGGFKSKGSVREYTFTVREQSTEPREFTLAIPNIAFDERRVRYQDAPDVCSLKLRKELAAHANHPVSSHYAKDLARELAVRREIRASGRMQRSGRPISD